jgi:hypothetical protein
MVAFHLRRRLSEREQENIGTPVDLRGTVEADNRLLRVALVIPPAALALAEEELK